MAFQMLVIPTCSCFSVRSTFTYIIYRSLKL